MRYKYNDNGMSLQWMIVETKRMFLTMKTSYDDYYWYYKGKSESKFPFFF
jgi:hypothetical protein